MNARKRLKLARNIDRYPVRPDSVAVKLKIASWMYGRKLMRLRSRWPGSVAGLWIGTQAAHEYHRRYRARMKR